MSIREIMLIAIGGAVGATARAVLDRSAELIGAPAQFGTLLINTIGSFLAALLVALVTERSMLPEDLRSFAIIGLLGGFTTFSTFAVQLARLSTAGELSGAAIYALGSLVLGVLAALAGLVIGRGL